MFKYLIRLFTVFSLLFPVVTHAIVAPIVSPILPECQTTLKNDNCASFTYADSCYTRPSRCGDSATCTPTEKANCYVNCKWEGCGDIIEPVEPAEICKPKQVPAGCLEVSYDTTCTEFLNPCQLGDDDCRCEVKFIGCNATCQFNCGQGYYITSNTNGIIGPTCAKCGYGCRCDGVFEDCSCDGQVVNGVCVSCPNGLVENGVCVDCTKNGTCKNGQFTGCNEGYIKYYETDRWACVACGDRCMDNSTCPLYGECSTDTSNTGPEFEQCFDGFKMVLDLDAGSVKCLCADNAYINSSGQCVACLDNAVCSDEKVTGCNQGFQKLTDESGNIIGCAGCTPNGTCSKGEFQYCNANYYGDKSGCYKCPDYASFASLEGKSTPGSNKVIGDCSVTASKDGALGEDERGYFYFETETGTCNATNATTK